MRVAHVVTNIRRGGAQEGVMVTVRRSGADDEVHVITGPDARSPSYAAEARHLLGDRLHIVPWLRREIGIGHDAHAALDCTASAAESALTSSTRT